MTEEVKRLHSMKTQVVVMTAQDAMVATPYILVMMQDIMVVMHHDADEVNGDRCYSLRLLFLHLMMAELSLSSVLSAAHITLESFWSRSTMQSPT